MSKSATKITKPIHVILGKEQLATMLMFMRGAASSNPSQDGLVYLANQLEAMVREVKLGGEVLITIKP